MIVFSGKEEISTCFPIIGLLCGWAVAFHEEGRQLDWSAQAESMIHHQSAKPSLRRFASPKCSETFPALLTFHLVIKVSSMLKDFTLTRSGANKQVRTNKGANE